MILALARGRAVATREDCARPQGRAGRKAGCLPSIARRKQSWRVGDGEMRYRRRCWLVGEERILEEGWLDVDTPAAL